MGMIGDFIPCPKPVKQEKKKKGTFGQRKPIAKKPKETKPKLQKTSKLPKREFKIPSKKVRGTYTEAEYQKAINVYGIHCLDPRCGRFAQEMHHAYFRSGGGRGTWRNAVPLCTEHHIMCHKEREYADYWRDYLEKLYGEHYYKDMYDLWMEGLIEEPSKSEFEAFMESEQLKLKKQKQKEKIK